jgi:predicted negative regulator of RcsB-dependent stress response
VEKDPVTPEDQEETSEEGRENMKAWFTENMRMIVSVVIVVVIAAGIYTYSKRAQAPSTPSKVASTEQNAEGKISVIGGDNESANTESATDQTQVSEETQMQTQPAEKSPTAAPQTSQETENSFVETAAKGDGSTNLARRALANYLEKNADSSLSAEQKIYIEDFLRRQVKDGRLKIGDTREFSKDTIAKAIEKSKGLSEKQLQNLQQYSQRVPGLK